MWCHVTHTAVTAHLNVPVVYNTSTKESAAHNQVIVQRERRRFLPRVSTPPGSQCSPKMREHQVALRVAPVEYVCLLRERHCCDNGWHCDKYMSRMDTCRFVGTVHFYKYWLLVRFPPYRRVASGHKAVRSPVCICL